ncbi:uncharacterized protein LOC126600686 [Malus sylvestris]|uniref:uncharacterized protein LOC126600686 n=1 Tax=Malus sylvestris TaxID=3752 RepID=UPI0021ABA96A|nr:uncharacterized protein LOC126600686 [Malus sylvestris]XP_050123256.1 uncharacterized protein LOC126600686 [Malus sylvestris]XP_050123257.1 uncharacterized protein LOC126600686 [Malus sylvestris]XP_050123258.1 uncharacterized protein LOC126600686 [Malus sylvestris]XP_050123259.1 uncharacterized protein LOC126600686 [Malus sylvestris]XP_050123260.1 uncharacterized protein LOC126600686 [Malus sylvestris]XP_050123261.1 uncharacterized protein LOC126600686 [Malus sylvestris]
METTLEIHWSYWCNPLELLVRPLGCTPSVRRKYTDLAEADRSLILEHFRQATMRWNPEVSAQSAVDNKSVKDEQKSHMIVATDACLPLLPSGESPIAARVLINYELPTKKETYTSRMTTCLAADGIVINMVVGGEVVTLKSLEESSNLVIAEMPIHLINMSNANLFSKLPFYKTQALWREGT